MDALSALLRTAMRIAGAGSAIVAFDDDPTPVAFQGCSLAAATVALRDGSGVHVNCPTPDTPASLVLLGAPAPSGVDAALDAVARELGVALLDAAPRAQSQLGVLVASVESLADAVLISRAPGERGHAARIAYVNAAFERLFGFTTHDLVDHTDDALFSAESLESVALVRERLADGEPIRRINVAMRSRDGESLWVELAARTVRGDDDRPKFYVFTLTDITARRVFEAAVAAEKQRLTVTLKAIGDAVVTVLPDGRIEFINAAAQRLLGLGFSDAYNAPLRSVLELRTERGERREIALDPGGDVRGEGVLSRGERHMHVAFVSSPIIAMSGATLGFVIVLRDITAQARLTRRLAYEASHDPLTRLPNRRHFEQMIAAALESAKLNGTVHTVAYIDLDRFKIVNDTMGHQAGDRLLRELAQRMALNVRGNDILARIGGDEFALLLHECSTANATRVAEKVRASVEAASHEFAGTGTWIGASVGLAVLDRDSASVADVLEAADRACYAAKASGRNTIVVAGSSTTS